MVNERRGGVLGRLFEVSFKFWDWLFKKRSKCNRRMFDLKDYSHKRGNKMGKELSKVEVFDLQVMIMQAGGTYRGYTIIAGRTFVYFDDATYVHRSTLTMKYEDMTVETVKRALERKRDEFGVK